MGYSAVGQPSHPGRRRIGGILFFFLLHISESGIEQGLLKISLT